MNSLAELSQRISQLSDDKLIELIQRPEEFRPEALEIIQLELLERGYSPSDFPKIRKQSKKSEGDPKAKLKPLWYGAYFFFSFLTITPFFFFAFRYWSRRGYDMRSIESINYTLMGILFYLLMIILLFQLGVLHLPRYYGNTGDLPLT